MKQRKWSDDELDELLRGHLAAELRQMEGRAVGAFEARLAAERRSAPLQAKPLRRTRGRAWVIAGVIGTSLAASLAGLWAVPVVWGPPQDRNYVDERPSAPSPQDPDRPVVAVLPDVATSATQLAGYQFEQVEQEVSRLTQDKGLLLAEDHTPVRVLRQVEMRRTQWVDPRNDVRLETEEPQEKTVIMLLDPY